MEDKTGATGNVTASESVQIDDDSFYKLQDERDEDLMLRLAEMCRYRDGTTRYRHVR